VATTLRASGLSGLLVALTATSSWADDAASKHAATPAKSATGSAGDAEAASSEAESSEAESSEAESTEAESSEADAPVAAKASFDAPASELLVGLRYRGLIVPQFVWGLFAEGGRGLYVNAFGPELVIENERREYNLSAWLAFYGMDPTGFKGKSDDEEAWEILELDLKVLYLTSDFLWHSPLSPRLDVTYGFGVGLGFVFGDMLRTQAYLTPGGSQGNADDYAPCVAVGNPNGQYCDDVNQHYDGYSEKSWFGGGPKPSLVPWLAGQAGLRYRISDAFLARVEAGIGLGTLFFGVGGDYTL
jgi:hypothetical protein